MRIYIEKQPNGNYDVVCDHWYTPEIPPALVAETIEMLYRAKCERLADEASKNA